MSKLIKNKSLYNFKYVLKNDIYNEFRIIVNTFLTKVRITSFQIMVTPMKIKLERNRFKFILVEIHLASVL